MKDDFSWLDDENPVERAPDTSGNRRGLRRFLPRLPGLPRLRRRSRARADASSAPDSAAAMLEARDNRPVEELDDRLRSLRERSFGGQPPGASGSAALFDVDEVLVTPEFQRKPGGVISAVALSKAQEQQVELLKDIVGGSLDASAEDDGERRRLDLAPRFSLSALIRLALSALLMTVVALPFVSSDYAIGDLTAPEDRPALTSMYDLLDDLGQDEYVLVGLEYGPTAAGELDALADLLLRHIVAKSAKPLIVSSNPIALIHAQNIIRKINRSVAAAGLSLEANKDYYLLRYLPGGALGLRELSENFADVARVSAKGELTGLEVSALEDHEPDPAGRGKRGRHAALGGAGPARNRRRPAARRHGLCRRAPWPRLMPTAWKRLSGWSSASATPISTARSWRPLMARPGGRRANRLSKRRRRRKSPIRKTKLNCQRRQRRPRPRRRRQRHRPKRHRRRFRRRRRRRSPPRRRCQSPQANRFYMSR